MKAWFRDIIINTLERQSKFFLEVYIYLKSSITFIKNWFKANYFAGVGSVETELGGLGKFSFETIIKNWLKTNCYDCLGVSNQNSSDCESLVLRHHNKHFENTIKVS